MRWYLIGVLVCISLIISGVEDFFTSAGYLYKPFCPVFDWAVSFVFVTSCDFCAYIWYQSLISYMECKIFFTIHFGVSILVIVSFAIQNLFSLMSSQLFAFLFYFILFFASVDVSWKSFCGWWEYFGVHNYIRKLYMYNQWKKNTYTWGKPQTDWNQISRGKPLQ